ncbi:MAG: DUF6531 domain-containing protein, partial [Chloroflexota bacterium]
MTPGQVAGLAGFTAVSAGGALERGFVLALKNDGSVWSWGDNTWGQIGDNTTVDRLTPAQVSGITSVGQVSSGGSFSAALVVSTSPPVESAPIRTLSEALPYPITSSDPVNTLTGGFLYNHVDVMIPGRGPSPAFSRGYSSSDTRVGPLGPGWTHNYNVRLRSPAAGSADLILVNAQGGSLLFVHQLDGSYKPPDGITITMVKNADGSFTAANKDGSAQLFDSAGNLTGIRDRHGNTSTLTYTSGRVTSVSDPAGRGALTFAYDACSAGRLCSITDWMSPARTVSFGYDGSGRLTSATDREGKTTSYGYDGTSQRL